MKTKIGILGSGDVAKALAQGFLTYGHKVKIGSSSQEKLAALKDTVGAELQTGSFRDAAEFGKILVLAVKGVAAEQVLETVGKSALKNKIIIDATNPIAETPPVNGVLQFFTGPDGSLLEQLQWAFPEARMVKAFNSVGSALMVNPQFEGGRPTMFIAGNDAEAKREVTKILDVFGWDTEDMGAVEAARAIEPLCVLWCIPGFLRNQWSHAFKLLR